MTILKSLLVTASSIAVATTLSVASAQESDEAGSSELRQGQVVVTGTRTANRTALETAVPVDVFPVEELTETGRV
jgi:iron complex outermembrane receptor protein